MIKISIQIWDFSKLENKAAKRKRQVESRQSAFLTWIFSAEGCVETGGKAWSAIPSSGSRTYNNRHKATINHYLAASHSPSTAACSWCIRGRPERNLVISSDSAPAEASQVWPRKGSNHNVMNYKMSACKWVKQQPIRCFLLTSQLCFFYLWRFGDKLNIAVLLHCTDQKSPNSPGRTVMSCLAAVCSFIDLFGYNELQRVVDELTDNWKLISNYFGYLNNRFCLFFSAKIL